MIWLITLTILWIIGGMFYFSLFVVSKRADEMAEVMFAREIMKPQVSGAFNITNGVHYLDDEKEIIGKICLSQ